MLAKTLKRLSRHKKVRARISGTTARPRLAIFKSNTGIYAQLINDVAGVTLAAASDIKDSTGTKTERARKVGTAIAEAGKTAGITSVVFDRGGFAYAGRIQALADAAREAGLQF
jgi:large subunit ribosomal protein L18